jgi:hypothetical protein
MRLDRRVLAQSKTDVIFPGDVWLVNLRINQYVRGIRVIVKLAAVRKPGS